MPAFIFSFLFSTTAFAQTPLVMGHRGACGYAPEHTSESYRIAVKQGADYIEPDLVMTKDGVLIVRHENEISETTDVASKFPDRKVTKNFAGHSLTGWFTEDFTIAEIKTLRAKERLPNRSHELDFKFPIMTFDEFLTLSKELSKESGREIGVIPEIKHPVYFKSIGLPLEPALMEALNKHGLNTPQAKVIIQSFEFESLKELKKTAQVPLLFLYEEAHVVPTDHLVKKDKRTYGDLLKPNALKEIAKVASFIGPYKRLIVPEDKNGKLLNPTNLIRDAHKAKLKVVPYTFRSDKENLAKEYEGKPNAEYAQFFKLGVDGVFTDFPDHAVEARNALKK